MMQNIDGRRLIGVLLGLAIVTSISVGIILGLILAGIKNYQYLEEMDVTQSALPTQIFDTNGILITEFFQDEKREIVPLEDVPQHLINAILVREDQDFYEHRGFSIRGILRAAIGIVTNNYQGGGSTITIQVAGNKYADRSEMTLKRKLIELWYALQLEKHFTKNEILEFYLNEMPFGGGTNGVEAASKFYFRKSVRDISLAESVLLINALSSHTKYSPIKNPEIARERQRQILDEMVKLGYATEEEADLSFQEYWDNYDFTRFASYGAWSEREDRAPWFSEYIRIQLEDLLLGSQDIYRGGLKVYTTLNLEYQKVADEIMKEAILDINERYQSQARTRLVFSDETFIPLVDLLSLTFNLRDIRTAGSKKRAKAERIFHEEINPVMDLVSSVFNIEPLKKPAKISFRKQNQEAKRTEVEGALVCIGSRTGHILAMVGGSEFSSANQFNRAVQAGLQPGSAFKPLYYNVAIESGKFTTATQITDRPVVFWNDDGTPYTPTNFMGRWRGRVLLRFALAQSMNVPSLKVFEALGYDAVIERASRMLGIRDPAEIEATFPRKIPMGLGIISISPLQMARAFATFPNRGREVEPVSIRYILDRNDKVILEPEKEAIARKKRPEAQIMSPQAAYIITDILQSVVQWGTLAHGKWTVGGFDGRPIAGKTGTTQNWADAWAIGFTPQMTTSIWFGFDTPGNSLGLGLTGSTAAGPVWAKYMKRVHQGLPMEQFPEPMDGIVEVTICEESGLLPDPEGNCNGHTKEEIFLKGTEPKEFCNIHKKERTIKSEIVENLRNTLVGLNLETETPFSLETEDLFSLEDIESGEGTSSSAVESTSANPLLD
jgi:penicillin-binding protein 1A